MTEDISTLDFVAFDTETTGLPRQEPKPTMIEFAGILYPNCLAPVEFVEYTQVDANAAFRRV